MSQELANLLKINSNQVETLEPIISQFPIFDPVGVERSKFQEFTLPGLDVKVGFHLPVFANAPYPQRFAVRYYPDNHSFYSGPLPMHVKHEGHNYRMQMLLRDHRFRLDYFETISPEIPLAVRAKVDPIAKQFIQIATVFEAEWELHGFPINTAADPFVIGQKEGVWFLLAAWDLTKMESYVVSEFVRKS
jgi:hypothetical protein